MWREFISALEPAAEFAPGAAPEEFAALEGTLGVALPGDLKDLLSESNGVMGAYNLHLLWSVTEIQTRNAEYWKNSIWRSRYMPLDALLFFADAGNGELFALSIIQGAVARPDVYYWNPINDSRIWAAPSLNLYLEWWLTGKLNL